MREKYQRKERKSNHKFEVVRGQELLVRVPLPMAEVWAEKRRRHSHTIVDLGRRTTWSFCFVLQNQVRELPIKCQLEACIFSLL